MKIVKRDEAITLAQLIALIYGEPGTGKTSLGFSLANALLLDCDRGAHRSAFRGDTVQVEAWADIANLDAKDFKGYDTVVVDTVGRLLDLITAHLAASDSRHTRGTGELSLQGYGALKQVFHAWISRLQTFGLDILLVAHSKEDKRAGDKVVQRPDIQGGSYAEVLKVTDMVGFLYRGQGGTVLDFSPSDTHVGKNAPGFVPWEVPDLNQEPDFLANVFARAKSIINDRNHASQETADTVAEWRKGIDITADGEELSQVLDQAKSKLEKTEPAVWVQVRNLISEQSKALGVTYDKKAKVFVAPESENVAA
jgi:hypothetical protein